MHTGLTAGIGVSTGSGSDRVLLPTLISCQSKAIRSLPLPVLTSHRAKARC